NVYLWDRQNSSLKLVSHLPGNPVASGNNISYGPVFSPDGSQLAFVSVATDLVGGVTDTNNATDLFVFDVASGSVGLASPSAGGTATGNGTSGDPYYFSENDPYLDVDLAPTNYVFSANNQYLFFNSKADNLVSGITFPANHHLEVFRRDLVNH